MASLMLHLLIGEKYCQKNNIKNNTDFLLGNFAPDLTNDKNKSHFTKFSPKQTFTMAAINKVDISQFSQQTFNLQNDFEKGEFYHLITDYYFYTQYLINEPKYQKLYNSDYNITSQLLYEEYNIVGQWIKNNYPNLNYNLLPKQGMQTQIGEMQIFSTQSLTEFIEFCSNLNLEEIYNKLITTKTL